MATRRFVIVSIQPWEEPSFRHMGIVTTHDGMHPDAEYLLDQGNNHKFRRGDPEDYWIAEYGVDEWEGDYRLNCVLEGYVPNMDGYDEWDFYVREIKEE